MDKLRALRGWFSSAWGEVIIFFGVAIVAFGLILPKLGYYMDDWHFVYYAHTFGLDSLNELLLYDSRPYAAWLYILGFKFLGFQPIVWHFASLLLRGATAFVFLRFFQRFWSEQKSFGFSVALIFLVYPFFLLQPMAVAYFIHWFGFFLYALSLLMMLLAFERSGMQRFFLISFALFFAALHLFTSEYFAGLELLRGLLLWMLIARREKKFLPKLFSTLKNWIPYLMVLALYGFWRAVLFVGPVERNTLVLLEDFRSAPFATLFMLLSLIIKDAVAIFFNGWQKFLLPDAFDITSLFTVLTLFLMGGLFVLLIWVLPTWREGTQKSVNNEIWRREALLLGLVILPLGELPIWAIGKAITLHVNQLAATRFGLASMLGAAILFSLLIDFFVTESQKRNITLALVISLAVGVHLHNAHEFEQSWEKQKNLYQQLVLRIPAMEPNTTLIAAGEILFFMGEYPTANVINTIYASDGVKPEETEYWFSAIYGSYDSRWDEFRSGMPLEEGHLSSQFHGYSQDSIVVSFEPGLGQCLWVLSPADESLPLLSNIERQASQISALDRILLNEEAAHLPVDIFGTEMPQNWCSYYQKADLARQRGNWEEVTALWEEAQANQKRPANGFEYIPFIEGYAYLDDWGQVKKLTRQSNKLSQGMYHILCPTLENLESSTQASDTREAALIDLRDYLACQ